MSQPPVLSYGEQFAEPNSQSPFRKIRCPAWAKWVGDWELALSNRSARIQPPGRRVRGQPRPVFTDQRRLAIIMRYRGGYGCRAHVKAGGDGVELGCAGGLGGGVGREGRALGLGHRRDARRAGGLGVGAVLPAARVGEFPQCARRNPDAVSAECGEVYCRMLRKAGQRVGADCEIERFTFGDGYRQCAYGFLAETRRRVGIMFVCGLRADLVAVISGQAPVVFSRRLKSGRGGDPVFRNDGLTIRYNRVSEFIQPAPKSRGFCLPSKPTRLGSPN